MRAADRYASELDLFEPPPTPQPAEDPRESWGTFSFWIGDGEAWRTVGKLHNVSPEQARAHAVKLSRRRRNEPSLCRQGEKVRVWRDAAHVLDGRTSLLGSASRGNWAEGESDRYRDITPEPTDGQYVDAIAAAIWRIRHDHMAPDADPVTGKKKRTTGTWLGTSGIRWALDTYGRLDHRPPRGRLLALVEQLETRGWLYRHPDGRPRWRVTRAMLSEYKPPEVSP